MRKRISTLIIAASLCMPAFAQLTPECNTLLSQHNQYLSEGNIDKAVSCAQKAKDAYVKAGSERYHADYINLVVSLLQEYSGQGNHKKSLECCRELIELFEENRQTDDLNFAMLCNFAADELVHLGDMAQALQFSIRQMETLCKMEGVSLLPAPQNPGWQYPVSLVVSLLNGAENWSLLEFEDNTIFQNFGSRLININELELARQVLELTAQKMKSAGLDTEEIRTSYIYIIYNLHYIFQLDYNKEKDLECLSDVVAMSEKYGIDNPLISKLRIDYASLKGSMGQQDKKRMDQNNLEDLIQLANKAYTSSMFADVLKYGEKAIDIIRKNHEAEIENYIIVFNITGNAYLKTGDTKKAIDIYNELLAILKKGGRKTTSSYVVALNNIATIYNQLKDFENDMEFRMTAMRTIIANEQIALPATQFSNRRQEFVALSNLVIDNLCQLKTIKGEEIAVGITNNAMSLIDQDYKNEALRMLNSLHSKMDECVGLNNRAGYRILQLIGILYTDRDQDRDALRFFEAAELTTMAVFGDKSLEFANVNMSLSNIYFKLGNYEKQLEYAVKAEGILASAIGKNNYIYIDVIALMAKAKMYIGDLDGAGSDFEYWLSLIKNQIHDYFAFMTVAEKSEYYTSSIEPMADYVSVLAHKLQMAGNNKYMGLFYDYELLCKGLLLSSETAFNNYIRHCNNPQIQNLYAQYQKNGMIIKEESRKGEGQRIANYAELLSENSNIGHNLMTMCGEAADLSQNISTSWQDVRKSLKKNDVAIEIIHHSEGKYYALVLSADNKYPDLVPLFDERSLKRAVYEASDSDNGMELKFYETGVLFANTWQKLEPYLKPGCNVYFAPKGMLHQIAIEYAPAGDGTLAFKRYNIHRISSTRNLIQRDRNLNRGGKVYLYGGINYNYKIGGDQLKYLDGSLEEVNQIGECLARHNMPVTKLQGNNATVESFKAMSGGEASLIHVATHGIFQIAEGNSLENSGLAMSDMVMKSSAISGLDLSSTGLVVLSACETAKGNVSGEGVFGLQRAFKLAGCQTIIMSLWPVNDYATQIMMTDFYTNVYEHGMAERDAFYKSIENLKAKPGTTPWHWAAFIMLD